MSTQFPLSLSWIHFLCLFLQGRIKPLGPYSKFIGPFLSFTFSHPVSPLFILSCATWATVQGDSNVELIFATHKCINLFNSLAAMLFLQTLTTNSL